MIACLKHPSRRFDDGVSAALHVISAHPGRASDAAFQILIETLSRTGEVRHD